jgi:hypothetical protein
MLKPRQRPEHSTSAFARGLGVDPVLQTAHPDPTLLQPRESRDQIGQRTAHAIKSAYHQAITPINQRRQRTRKLRTLHPSPGISKALPAPRRAQRCQLRLKPLPILTAHVRIANPHPRIVPHSHQYPRTTARTHRRPNPPGRPGGQASADAQTSRAHRRARQGSSRTGPRPTLLRLPRAITKQAPDKSRLLSIERSWTAPIRFRQQRTATRRVTLRVPLRRLYHRTDSPM